MLQQMQYWDTRTAHAKKSSNEEVVFPTQSLMLGS